MFRIVYCVAETVRSDYGMFVWPNTDSGVIVIISCPNGPNGEVAVRTCTEYGTWNSTNATKCLTTVSSGFRNLSMVSLSFIPFISSEISHFQVNITTDNIVSVSRHLSNHVISATDTIDQTINNIRTISNILMESAALLSDNGTFNSLSASEATMVDNL